MQKLNRRQFGIAMVTALLLAATPAWAEKFTVAVVPDTQNYSDATLAQPRSAATFVRQMEYLVATRAEKKLVFASFVGDIVQHGDGQFRKPVAGAADGIFTYFDTRSEWDVANHAMLFRAGAGEDRGSVGGAAGGENAARVQAPAAFLHHVVEVRRACIIYAISAQPIDADHDHMIDPASGSGLATLPHSVTVSRAKNRARPRIEANMKAFPDGATSLLAADWSVPIARILCRFATGR